MKLHLVPGSSDRERQARAAKAEKLIDVLKNAEATPEQVLLMTDEHWTAVAYAAGVRVPSETTRKLVRDVFESGETK